MMGQVVTRSELSGQFISEIQSHGLRQPIMLKLVLVNHKSSPLYFTIGNTREDGFVFEIVDRPSGAIIETLDPYNPFGGSSVVDKIEAKSNRTVEIPLNKYFVFESVGRYVINASVRFSYSDNPWRLREMIVIENSVQIVLTPKDPAKIKETLNQLMADATGKDLKRRYRAVELLKEMRVPEATPHLKQLLQSRDLSVRCMAIRALGLIDTDEARSVLVEFAAGCSNEELKSEARRAIETPRRKK
jgi:hypothetical protein